MHVQIILPSVCSVINYYCHKYLETLFPHKRNPSNNSALVLWLSSCFKATYKSCQLLWVLSVRTCAALTPTETVTVCVTVIKVKVLPNLPSLTEQFPTELLGSQKTVPEWQCCAGMSSKHLYLACPSQAKTDNLFFHTSPGWMAKCTWLNMIFDGSHINNEWNEVAFLLCQISEWKDEEYCPV